MSEKVPQGSDLVKRISVEDYRDGHVLCWYRLYHVELSTGSIEATKG